MASRNAMKAARVRVASRKLILLLEWSTDYVAEERPTNAEILAACDALVSAVGSVAASVRPAAVTP